MADFNQLAQATKRLIPREERFVAGDAIVDSDDTSYVTATPDAMAQLADEGRKQAEGRTNLFFLKGDPGAGKTTLLREVAALQADRYMRGESDFLCLYVSAQGRELSNLRDAFSGELDDLRAGFTRDAVAALARAGLLIPIVDGFDELLGTAGYSGAFSSLQSLLSDLEGLGAIVVSARSAFYDLEFLGRSSAPGNQADISITTIGLKPWTDDQLRHYLTLNGRRENRVIEALERLSDGDKELLKRPFFASEFPSFARQSDGAGGIGLLEYLITSYIQREAEKIVDSQGDPVLPVDGHRRLFELTASEMWEGEARALSLDDLRTLTEVVAEEFGLGSDEAEQLSAKVTSYAGFRAGLSGARDDFAFEHEVYFDYFLTRAVTRLLESRSEEIGPFLDRGVLPELVAHGAVQAAGQGIGHDSELMKCSSGVRFDNRRRNFGALLAAYARETGPLRDAEVQDLAFIDLRFGAAHFNNVSFVNCDFLGVDLCGTVFDGCDGASSRFQALELDNETRIGIAGLRPGQNVGSVRHPAAGDLYAPSDIEEVLGRLGAPKRESAETEPRYSDRAQVLINLLHHAARAYRRTNLLYEKTEDKRLAQLFGNKYWPDLKVLLLKHGIITEETRGTSGPRLNALRLRVTVDQLLTGQTAAKLEPGPVANLWADLRRLK